jgi:hypothetical protein
MNAGVHIRDRDRGFKRIMNLLTREAKNARVDVGWFADKKHGDQQTAQIASHHEYGAPDAGIVARPMLRRTVDEHRSEYDRLRAEAYGKAIDGERIEKSLLRFGHRVRTDVVKTITTGPHPPLKQATIDRKGFDTPLIEFGVMRDQVDVRVKTGAAAKALAK